MNYHRFLDFSSMFEDSPQDFESWLFYRPPGSQQSLAKAIYSAAKPLKALPLLLPSPFSLMALEQTGILMSVSGYGELYTNTAYINKRGHRIRIKSGISRQSIYLSAKDILPIDQWRGSVAQDWLR